MPQNCQISSSPREFGLGAPSLGIQAMLGEVIIFDILTALKLLDTCYVVYIGLVDYISTVGSFYNLT